MARPQKYSDDDYETYIGQQLAAGRRLAEITAGELQQAVGGQYSRCQQMLDAAREQADQAGEPAQPAPAWFREFVEHIADQAHSTAEAQWARVGRGIRESIEEATTAFDQRRQELEAQTRSHLAQIERLETEAAHASEQLEALQQQLHEAEQLATRANADLGHAQTESQRQQAEIATLREQLQAATIEQGRLQGRVETLQEALERAQGGA